MSDLLDRLRRHIKIMAPHQKQREAGQLLIEAMHQISDDEATLHLECPQCQTTITELMTQDGCVACEYIKFRDRCKLLEAENARLRGDFIGELASYQRLERAVERIRNND